MRRPCPVSDVSACGLIDELGQDLSAGEQESLTSGCISRSKQWSEMSVADRRSLLLFVSAIIIVGEDEVRISLHRGSLRQALLKETFSDRAAKPAPTPSVFANCEDYVVLALPARLRSCSHEMRLLVPPAQAREMPPRPNAPLIKAVVRACRWKEKLFSGEVPSVRAIAEGEGLTERPVARTLRLAFLSPSITEAILEGRQPADLELQRLLKGVPLNWEEQHKLFGVGGPD